jgi:hypothetical protein
MGKVDKDGNVYLLVIRVSYFVAEQNRMDLILLFPVTS